MADGQDYGWIDRSREHLDHAGVRARLKLADLLTETDPGRAADLSTAAATLAPTDEDVARHAMRALARAGKPNAITALLQQLQHALHALGEPVSVQTTALATQLHRDTHRQPPAPPNPTS